MDILLINPKIRFEKTRFMNYPQKFEYHFGLCCLATNLELAGFEVGIIDSFPANLSEFEIMKFIKEIKPKLVGLTSLSVGLRGLYSLTKELKDIPDIEIIAGGFHLTLQPELLKVLGIKYGLLGEADLSIVELCKYLLKNEGTIDKIPGLAYLKNDEIKINGFNVIDDLDLLPTPSYDNFLVPVDRSISYLEASRGCKFRCAFCSDYTYRKGMSYRGPERLIDDIKNIQKKYNIHTILFTDDTFGINREHSFKIWTLIKKENIKLNFGILTRIDCIDEEILRLMVSCGLRVIYIGIDSGSYEIRKSLGKNFTDERCKKIIKLCRELGIVIITSFMIGVPGETMDDINKSINFALEIEPDKALFNSYVMVPGSPLYKNLEKQEIVSDKNWIEYMEGKGEFPIYIPPYLNRDKLLRLEIKAHRKFYTNFKRFFKVLKNRNLEELKHILLVLMESVEKEILKPLFKFIIFK